jgi:hypothetical protein
LRTSRPAPRTRGVRSKGTDTARKPLAFSSSQHVTDDYALSRFTRQDECRTARNKPVARGKLDADHAHGSPNLIPKIIADRDDTFLDATGDDAPWSRWKVPHMLDYESLRAHAIDHVTGRYSTTYSAREHDAL